MKKNLLQTPKFYSVFLLALTLFNIAKSQVTNGLLHEFRFNNSYTSTLGTATFSNIGETSFVTDRNGITNSALNINNGFAVATISNMPTGSNPRTISLWVKLNTFHSLGFNYLYNYGPGANANGVYINATLVNHYARNSSNTTNHTLNTSHTLNTWVHYAFTYDGSKSRIYKNGILIGTSVQNITTVSNNSFSLGVTEGGGTGRLNGVIDDLKIYNRALSANEVYEVYEQIPSTPVVQWNFPGHYGTTNSTTFPFSTPNGTGLSSDRFGNTNSALYINNSGSVATGVTSLPVGNSARTISFWFKRSQSDFQELFVYGGNGSTSCFGVYVTANGSFVNYHTQNNSTYVAMSGSSNEPIAPDTWHHITVVYTQDSSMIYRNGSSIGRFAFNSTLTTTGTNLLLGKVLTTSQNPFQGTIDEIKVYNGALSPLEIANQYATALPVTLKSFTAQVKNQTSFLQWQTAQEINTSHFEVEYSNNANEFKKVATIEASGNSNTQKNYSANHTINKEPIHYYRLKMVDKDGKFSYSEIVRLKNDTKGFLLDVYPTIVTNIANINITAIESSTATVEVYNTQGQKVQQQYIVLKPGTQSIKLDVSVLSKGNYFIRLVTNQQQLSTQIIKQ